MSILFPLLALLGGLGVLVWSSDRFVSGAASIARYFQISPLVIGMLIVGFGTSMPELLVSALSALEGKPALALGNAYGSNIANIGLILGITALVKPVQVHSGILRRELPLLTLVTLCSILLLRDRLVGRLDGGLMLLIFAAAVIWTLSLARRQPKDALLQGLEEEIPSSEVRLGNAIAQLIIGLVILVASSRALVWGAVELARLAGIGELVIGLTIVAVGTSLPELASSLAAVRKGEHDLAMGNVVGSNLFNTLAVVGLSACIQPFKLAPEVLSRDFPVMGGLTLSLFVIGMGYKRTGRINRLEGALLLAVFFGYIGWLLRGVLATVSP